MKRIIKIVDGCPSIVEDPWRVIAETGSIVDIDIEHALLPLPDWLAVTEPGSTENTRQKLAPWLSAEDDFEKHIEALMSSPLVAIEFPSFRDGRGYSTASLLRSRYGYTGELRAIGDILRDQLKHMRRCGFDSFAVRADKGVEDALKGLRDFSVHYQRSVIEPLPLYLRR